MNVFVAEGRQAVCGRLVELVDEQPGCGVNGTATDAEATLAALSMRPADVLLLGVTLADGNAFDLLRRLGERRCRMHIIMLCERLDAHYMYYAHGLGAHYVLEHPRDLELIPALMEHLRRDAPAVPATDVR